MAATVRAARIRAKVLFIELEFIVFFSFDISSISRSSCTTHFIAVLRRQPTSFISFCLLRLSDRLPPQTGPHNRQEIEMRHQAARCFCLLPEEEISGAGYPT